MSAANAQERIVITIPDRIYDALGRYGFLVGASILRIVFGISILWFYVSEINQRYELWGPSGLITPTISRNLSMYPGNWDLYSWSTGVTYFNIIYFSGLFVTVLYVLGFYPRVLGVLCYIFTSSLYWRNGYVLNGGNNILILELFFMMFMQTGVYFSWHSTKIRRKLATGSVRNRFLALVHNFAWLCVVIQICTMYFTSFLFKVQGKEWMHGTALYYIFRVHEFQLPGVSQIIYQNPVLVTLLTYGTLLFQGSFPFLVWNRHTKPIMIAVAIAFHSGIAWFMGLFWFSFIMIGIDAILISDDTYHFIWKLAGKYGAGIRGTLRTRLSRYAIVVYYDGQCPFCRRSVSMWQRLDMFKLLQFESFWDIPEEELPAPIHFLEAKIHSHSVRSKNTYRAGMRSVIQICSRIPVLIPCSTILYVLVRLGFGERLYEYVATRRYLIPVGKCEQDTCDIST